MSGGALPIVKWAGGKRRILPRLRALMPADVARRRHVEPFVGGAALFFASEGRPALLGDINAQLIATYSAVRADVESVIAHLCVLAGSHSPEQYYAVRRAYNGRTLSCSAESAAAFIYLNKTGFNGLYRVNRRGEFNVPIGRQSSPMLVDPEALRRAAVQLRRASLEATDFAQLSLRATDRDFVYLDPPYDSDGMRKSFCDYAIGGFGQQQQERLRDTFEALTRVGAKVMMSNSDTPRMRALYKGLYTYEVLATRSINARGDGREAARELVVCNYSPSTTLGAS